MTESAAAPVDVHSHAWEYPSHFGDRFRTQAIRARAGVEVDLTVRLPQYRSSAPPGTRTVVFGAKAKRSDLWVDDRYVAGYVTVATASGLSTATDDDPAYFEFRPFTR